jgi:3',5'-cyclic-AMP phosphodiesterase
MKLAWLTDIHLNFLADRRSFFRHIAPKADAFAIGGDISVSRDVVDCLIEMAEEIEKPIYYVLGNHDFYHGSIAKVREEVGEIRSEHLHYLSTGGVFELTPDTAIVGHDGWADGRLGNYEGTDVVLNDHVLIKEIARWNIGGWAYTLDKVGLKTTLDALAKEAADHLELVLAEAVQKYSSIILLTHVPPFKEASWHEGHLSDDNFLPWFACKTTGEAMRRVMDANPQSKLLVLCGHTHSKGEAQITKNIEVITGQAEYRNPKIQKVLTV